MAVSNVELIVSAAKAINPLRKVEAATKRVEAAFNKAQNGIKNTNGQLSRTGQIAGQASTKLSGLGKKVLAAAAAYATFNAAQSALRAGIQRIESERRIKFLAKSYGEVEQLSKAAADASVRFGQSQTTANKALAGIYARLRPVGVSLEDITSTYNGFNTAARISGATAVEAENAFTQLAQALGSGALRGDEFNSISEQVPGILTAISKETGIAQGQLRAYAAEGMITSDVVIRALKRIETEGAAQLEEALGGPSQAIADFQNAAEDVQVALTRDIVPQMAEVFKGLAELIINLEGPIRFIGRVAADTLNQINSLIVAATQPGAASARRDIESGVLPLNVAGAEELFKGTGPGGKGLAGMREQSTLLGRLRGQDRKKVLLQLMQDRLAAMQAETQVQPPTLSAPTISSFSLKNKKNGGAARAAKATKERVDMSQRLYELNKDLREQQSAGNELEIATLELMIKKQEIAESNLLPLEKRNALEEALFAFKQKNMDIDRQQAEERDNALKSLAEEEKVRQELLQKQLEADPGYQMKQQLEELVKLENQVAAGAEAISNAFANSFRSLITGAKSGEEALADMMSAVAEHFLDMATKIIAQQLAMILYGTIMKALGISMPSGPSFGGPNLGVSDSSLFDLNKSFFAEGGFVNKPTNAIIGEGSEPEYIIPESKMKESMMRYSRGARGNSVIPESGEGGASSEGSGTAVAAPIDVRYSVERINNVDYVTADQFQAGMRQAAQQGAMQGERRALTTLKQNTTQRRRIGL